MGIGYTSHVQIGCIVQDANYQLREDYEKYTNVSLGYCDSRIINFICHKLMKLTKEEALAKIEELKKYVEDEEKKVKKIVIYKTDGSVLFKSKKETIKEAVIEAVERGATLREADLYGATLYEANLYGANLREADLRGANLYGANLYGANLREADLQNAKFYGKGGTMKIKKNQVDVFFKALGVIVEE